jgi:hypothetical protein
LGKARVFTQSEVGLYLAMLWLLVNLGLLWLLGIRTGADTEVYVSAAHELLAGNLPEGRLVWYSSYIVLLSLVFGMGGGLPWIVTIQVLLSGVAAVVLEKGVRKLTGSQGVSFLAVFFYLAWLKIHQWNIFIYTEAVFTSLSVITFSCWLLSQRYWQYAGCLLLVLVTFFVRPTGFSFLAGWLLFATVAIAFSGWIKWAVSMLIILVALLLLNQMLGDFELVESYAQGEIIYPDISLGVRVPPDLSIPGKQHSPLLRLALFVWEAPWYFVKISIIKLGLFFANVKPYFSLAHNLLIILLLYPLYGLAIYGFRHFPENRKEKYFFAGYILAQAVTVMLTTENWDGRFLIPILPFVFILSAMGLQYLIKTKASPVEEEAHENG